MLERVPFSHRVWALPVLFRLYRNKKECAAKGHSYRKTTELGREMLDVLLGWIGRRRVEVTADNAYCNDTVLRGLPANVVVSSAMRPDAVLTDVPPPRDAAAGDALASGARCCPSRRRAPTTRDTPDAPCRRSCTARQRIAYKTLWGQRYLACGPQLLRIVIVRMDEGALKLRVFYCTDATLTAAQILEGYAGRWAIEISLGARRGRQQCRVHTRRGSRLV